MRIFWLAGENSGDLHASLILKELQQQKPFWNHFGIGGSNMASLGFKSILPFQKFSVMGFGEVIKHLGFFWQVKKTLDGIFRHEPPDLVVLVDYPGLNMRIAKSATRHNIPVLYFISPQFWAWKYNRIFDLKKYTTHIAYILPFEKEHFEKHNVPASFVGHPIAEEISIKLDKKEFAQKYNLDMNKKWIGFLPGSRNNEIKKMLPVYLETMKFFDEKKFICLLSKATTVTETLFQRYLKRSPIQPIIIKEDRYEMVKYCNFLAVTSGTATLETAYLGTPFLIAYKANPLSYLIGKKLIKIPKIGLPNIILDKDVIPELVQKEANSTNIHRTIDYYLSSQTERLAMIRELNQLQNILVKGSVGKHVTSIITGLIDE